MSAERKAMIAELKRQPGFDAWKSWALEIRETYFQNLARTLYEGGEVTAEDLAYKRGYFRAVARMFNEVDFSTQAVQRDLETTKDGESA